MVVSWSIERREIINIPFAINCIKGVAFTRSSATSITSNYDYRLIYCQSAKTCDTLVERRKSRHFHLVSKVHFLILVHQHFPYIPVSMLQELVSFWHELVEELVDLSHSHVNMGVLENVPEVLCVATTIIGDTNH